MIYTYALTKTYFIAIIKLNYIIDELSMLSDM